MPDVDVPDESLRPGLELAFVVAVLGTRQRPAIPPPPSLKRFLHFQKLPPAAPAVLMPGGSASLIDSPMDIRGSSDA